MILLSIVISLLGVYLMQDHGELTTNKIKQFSATVAFIVCGIVLSIEYGTLRGVFILLGLVSLVGTMFTLLRYKFAK
ncbi:hypothetical protein tloyanaT_31000 [Thalassotalea loyana]|uniref:Uncharacterized protein n=1 Tax=Thalassotalea loyana TaxID=280483 RepID=A0ABQ6HFH5_9GAMM|nr:hypothetical protein [Thalassotalea loyana]GLX86847.1 hypothetical protein tloyanaT_31000 [Thalassotalea loyana]